MTNRLRPHLVSPPAGLPALLALSLAALSCATAPPPQPAPPPPARPEVPDAALVCPESRFLRWAELGVPERTKPVDLALTDEWVWVLFDPSFLLRVPRAADGAVEPGFVSPPREGERWSAVDADPADGTLWVARRDGYEALHIEGTELRRVALQRVTGEGGLVELTVGPAALHASPFCADNALWSFARDGAMLAASFELPEGLGLEVDTSRTVNLGHACTRVHLARDPTGAVVAFDPIEVRLHRATDGGWEAIGGPFDLQPPDRYTASQRIEGIGPGDTARYLPDTVRGLAFLDGRPILLGSGVYPRTDEVHLPGPLGTVLYRVEGDSLQPVVERCGDELLLDLESDPSGHAAITASGLYLGSPAPPAG